VPRQFSKLVAHLLFREFFVGVTTLDVDKSLRSICSFHFKRIRLEIQLNLYAPFHVSIAEGDILLVSNAEFRPNGCLMAKKF
jgi:hypothetical protein